MIIGTENLERLGSELEADLLGMSKIFKTESGEGERKRERERDALELDAREKSLILGRHGYEESGE